MDKKFFKIISGAQSGVDRAALDAALSLGIAYGGSVPKDRKDEDGIIPAKYKNLTELLSPSYSARTKQNILDSDATLILCEGKPSGGTALTAELAQKHQKPFIVGNLKNHTGELVEGIVKWLKETMPGVLNIAGSRESASIGIYMKSYDILRMILSGHIKVFDQK